ncbi:zinc finger BED domain-containing protein RICESLEEPER 1-like isoform X2 [Silene latifolia]|uniref:zinc finger BED domain-containing protein RICESLEEPER 1-like isoform X2 n=1 Tax=Silene latifolia TaxID=37657 RepID=UPI003D779A56
MGETMQEKFVKYWLHSDGDDYNTLFAFALILDPRYKKQFLKYCYQTLFRDENRASSLVNDVLFKLRRLLDDYAPKENNVPTQSSSSNLSAAQSRNQPSNRKRNHDLVEFDSEEYECTTSTKSLLDDYLDDTRLNRHDDLHIFEFWKVNENKYGHLAYLVRDVLSVPLTTVASESTFSIGGRILNKWRSSYLPDNVEALITSCSWLYGYDASDEEEFIGYDVDWNHST